MANSKSDSKAPKTMDVVQPGKPVPSATARPVIMTNRSMLRQDPMISPDGMEKPEPESRPMISRVGRTLAVPTQETAKEQKAPATAPATSIKVKDVSLGAEAAALEKPAVVPQGRTPEEIASKKAAAAETAAPTMPRPNGIGGPATAEPEKPATPPSKPVAEPEAPKPAAPVVADTPDDHPVSSSPSTEPAAAAPAPDISLAAADKIPAGEDGTDDESDSTDGQLAPNKAIDDAKHKADEAAAARVAEQEKIIASRQYYLPIRTAGSRRGVTRSLVVLLLVLVLAVVWFDMVLDAGILHVGNLHALTHFFG